MSSERVFVGEEEEAHSCTGTEDRKGGRVWSEESGDREYQKQSGEYGRVCKVEDSHRDKTEQWA